VKEHAVPQTPLDKLTEVSPDIADGFKKMRKGVLGGGPLTEDVVELIVVGALSATRQLEALDVHLRRLMAMDVEPAAVRQALVAPLGAASTLTETVEGLDLYERLLGESS
jgi:alkylhydroperoxidase/carboxymuconolactone decarboxylase family protein YurZ